MLRLRFTKMSGAGNDFVVIDNRTGVIRSDRSVFARVVAERRFGIGADGVMLLEKSNRADFSMKYYNSDGSYGGFCGNGGRCIARYAHVNRITDAEMDFESLDHIYHAVVKGERVRLRMRDPKNEMRNLKLRSDGKVYKFHYLDTGAPHCVIFLDENSSVLGRNLDSIDVPGLGRKISHDPFFGKSGTNVNFAQLNEGNTVRIRTYERGVEGETLACGTGSVASALLAGRLKGVNSPVRVTPKSGRDLFVRFVAKDGGTSKVYLEGDARTMFIGELIYDSKRRLVSWSPAAKVDQN